jgi:gamma-glutamyltranspeptidase/glutathione hydrolase
MAAGSALASADRSNRIASMDWHFPYPTPRKPLLADNVVATTQPLAAQAGLAMLAAGGSAADAAVAAAIALTVVEPTMNGIGGDAFAIIHDGAALHGLNASGRAPMGWSPERFGGLGEMPDLGWECVTVPGAVSAWAALHSRFGRLPFARLFEPAIRYARDGFLVGPVVAEYWRRQADRLRSGPHFAATFLPGGRAPLAGERFRNPDQAATLEELAASGGESFYRGRLAEAIAAAARAEGGAMTVEDLAAHQADWVTPLSVDFRGHTVHELPPNGQGLAALIALGILERLDLVEEDVDSDAFQHLLIEATKLGIADMRAYVADPASMGVRPEALLDPAYLDERARAVRPDRAAPQKPGQPRGGTVYLAAADAGGMMVSFIQSNYAGFGSGVVIPGTGIAMHNRGNCFSLDPAHPNRVAGGKRPLNTIIPGFISRDGAPLMAFGCMGGVMQPQGHVQIAVRMLARNHNPQAAIDAPRWRLDGGELYLEPEWPENFRAGLAARGHAGVDGDPLHFGAAQIIRRMPAGGYIAGSESRRDGQAVGF